MSLGIWLVHLVFVYLNNLPNLSYFSHLINRNGTCFIQKLQCQKIKELKSLMSYSKWLKVLAMIIFIVTSDIVIGLVLGFPYFSNTCDLGLTKCYESWLFLAKPWVIRRKCLRHFKRSLLNVFSFIDSYDLWLFCSVSQTSIFITLLERKSVWYSVQTWEPKPNSEHCEVWIFPESSTYYIMLIAYLYVILNVTLFLWA